MASLTVNISLPVLLANQGFRVEYRDGPLTPWTLFGVETTNTIVITGLSAWKCYDIRITFLQSISPLVECDPEIWNYCIPDELPCGSIDGEITLEGDIYELTISVTPPSPATDPCGGWILEYGPVTSPQQPYTVVPFASMLTSPAMFPMSIPIPANTDYYIALYAVDCEGNYTLCDSVVVTSYSEPCEHATIDAVEIIEQSGAYYLQIAVFPSVPPSSVYYISYYQANAVTSGVPDPGGTVIVTPAGTPTPEIFLIPISPNVNVANNIISYVGAVIDGCKHSSRFDISYPLD